MDGGEEHLIDILCTACFTSSTSPLVDRVHGQGESLASSIEHQQRYVRIEQ